MTIPIIRGLSEIAARYDGFVLDIWGVVHQGGPAYPEVVDCLAQLKKLDRPVVFLSNAPRRAVRVERLLESKGISATLHRGVISSGEIARLSLEARRESALASLGPRYLSLGAERDGDLLDGLDFQEVTDPSDADFILAIGLDDARSSVAHYETVLTAAAKRDLPLLCVNPDLVVVRLGVRELCAGALAARYKELGGRVHYFGKPFEEAYPPTLARLGLTDRQRVLAVGDGLETDIKGAQKAGLATLLVTGGLLADALGIDRLNVPAPEALEAACREAGAVPDGAIATLRW